MAASSEQPRKRARVKAPTAASAVAPAAAATAIGATVLGAAGRRRPCAAGTPAPARVVAAAAGGASASGSRVRGRPQAAVAATAASDAAEAAARAARVSPTAPAAAATTRAAAEVARSPGPCRAGGGGVIPGAAKSTVAAAAAPATLPRDFVGTFVTPSSLAQPPAPKAASASVGIGVASVAALATITAGGTASTLAAQGAMAAAAAATTALGTAATAPTAPATVPIVAPGAAAPAAGVSGVPFLRLSSRCVPSVPMKQLVYLSKDALTFGRLPSSDVVLDSKRVPQMISRVHGRVVRRGAPDEEIGETESWVLHDNRSLNGVTVNGAPVGAEGCALHTGDVVVFGLPTLTPPEFEFVFEAPLAAEAKRPAHSAPSMEELFGDQMRQISELQRELDAERQQKEAENQQRRLASQSVMDLVDLQADLVCSVCQDFMVHSATIECSHTFCWACVDAWLLTKRFECPVCRTSVTREPVRSRALDAIVQKYVERLSEVQREDFTSRVDAANKVLVKGRRLHDELEKSVNEALNKGKAFFHIDTAWSRRERETFQRGVKDYTGATRTTYCRLTGLTEQWVHSADDAKLNKALHNLQLQAFVDKSADEIRQRLLMFLRYG